MPHSCGNNGLEEQSSTWMGLSSLILKSSGAGDAERGKHRSEEHTKCDATFRNV